MSAEYRTEFRRALMREPLRHLARVAQFQARWFEPRRLAGERALAAAQRRGRNVVPASGLMRPPAHLYQGYRGPWIEDYFFHHWLRHPAASEVGYLPVFWTDLFLQAQTHRFTPRQYERFLAEMKAQLAFADATPRCYFTLLEYDHMIWGWNAFPRNVAVFSAGGWGDIPIPLLKGSPEFSCPKKDIRVSFVGQLGGGSNATGVRGRMHAALRDHALFTSGANWRDLMARSTFSLCPRGLGRTSFRLYEALSVGSIPIYLWDDRPWLPYAEELDWSEFSLSLHIDEVGRLPEILAGYDAARIARMQERIRELYPDYFTLEGMSRQILRMVDQLADRGRFRRLMEARPYLPGHVPERAIPAFLQPG
jgi:hypothetical protein